jgi:hypothetical protein
MKRLSVISYAALLCGLAYLPLMAFGKVPLRAEVQDKPDAVEINSTYDKKKNETEVKFTMLPLASNETQRVLLGMSASYKGQKPKAPEDVIFILQVLSSGSYRYPDAMAMQVVIEGKKVSDVLMVNFDKRRLDQDYLETIGTRMKYDLFQRLLKASSAELRLGSLALPLEATQVTKLREFDALLH